MLFRIVNPCDPYTIESSSLDVAVMASVMLDQGHYPFESLDGGQDIPSFLLVEASEWCKEKFGEGLMELSNRVMDTKLGEVADCLDSVLYGDKEEREAFLEETKDMNRETFVAMRFMRQDERRSSINDLGERAYRMAAQLRKSIEDGMKTLQ